MNTAQQKLVQYLNEAHATEQALIRVLQSQIAMAPRGSYRSGLETHLRETRDHAARVGRRRQALGQGSNLLVRGRRAGGERHRAGARLGQDAV